MPSLDRGLKGADHLARLRIFRYGETHVVGRFFTLIVVVNLILIVAQYLVLDKIKDRLQRDHPQAWGSFRFPEPSVNWDEDEPIQNGAKAALRSDYTKLTGFKAWCCHRRVTQRALTANATLRTLEGDETASVSWFLYDSFLQLQKHRCSHC
jgi:hypothetical protein